MVTLTVELDQEKDLPVLQALLSRLSLNYHIEDDDYVLSDAELEGIEAGLADIEAGRVYTNEQVQKYIRELLKSFKNKGKNND